MGETTLARMTPPTRPIQEVSEIVRRLWCQNDMRITSGPVLQPKGQVTDSGCLIKDNRSWDVHKFTIICQQRATQLVPSKTSKPISYSGSCRSSIRACYYSHP